MKKQYPLSISEEKLNILREEARSKDISLNALLKTKIFSEIKLEEKTQ